MAESTASAARGRLTARVITAALAVVTALACLLPGTAAAAAAAPITGWLSAGTALPHRSLVLIAPPGATVNASTVHVTENGTPIAGLTVTPTTEAGTGDFGLVVVADQGRSMKGAALTAVMSAVRHLAAARRAAQQLGVVTFDATPHVLAPLSSDPAALQSALAATPATGSGAGVTSALALALKQIASAHVALGAIVLVSDGAGALTAGGPSAAAIKNAAASAQVPVFTVGLQDHAGTRAAQDALRAVGPGHFVQTPPARLSATLAEIDAALTRASVVRWSSSAPAGHSVAVAATLDGAAGQIGGSYTVPAAPKAARGATHAGSRANPLLAHTSGHLSKTPSFATPAPARAATPAAPTSGATAAPASFWSSPAGTPVIAALVGVLVAIAVMLALHRPSNRAVRIRVGSFIPATPDIEVDPLLAAPVPKLGMLERQKWWPAYALDVEIARAKLSAQALIKRAALFGIIGAALVYLLSGSSLLAFIPLLGWPFVLRKMMARGAEKQREKFRQTLPGYLQDLASAIRVGRSINGALSVVAESADEPTKSELGIVVTDEALGRPLDAALEAVAERMEAPDLGQVALIAALNKRSGSNVAEALDRVSEGARERADLKREVKALTAQAKMSSWVLTALPGVLLVGLMLISPIYAHPLFHTTLGVILLGVGACMVFAGWKAMSKITDVKV